jgi:hypothetical protein
LWNVVWDNGSLVIGIVFVGLSFDFYMFWFLNVPSLIWTLFSNSNYYLEYLFSYSEW